MTETKLYINEIFYSLQGEGINSGRAAIFIRLSKCNLRCSYCDTDFESGTEMSIQAIMDMIAPYESRFIIWTGGEPTLQLTEEIVAHFRLLGYEQAIETNGTRRPPMGLDYITCSPKPEAMKRLHESFPNGVSEFRFPIGADGALPPSIETLPRAKAYLVSPIFVGEDAMQADQATIERCVNFILKNPRWRLSLQTHKLINIK